MPVFPILSRGFLHIFESKYFQSKEEFYQECLKVIFLSFPSPFQFLFSHTTLEPSIAISTYRDLLWEDFRWSKCCDHQSSFLVLWGGGQVCSRCFEFGCELVVWGAASASLWACGVYGLESPRSSSMNSACRCCGTEEWSGGIDFSGNPSRCWRRGCRASVLEPRNKSLVFAIALFLFVLLFISCILVGPKAFHPSFDDD